MTLSKKQQKQKAKAKTKQYRNKKKNILNFHQKFQLYIQLYMELLTKIKKIQYRKHDFRQVKILKKYSNCKEKKTNKQTNKQTKKNSKGKERNRAPLTQLHIYSSIKRFFENKQKTKYSVGNMIIIK